MGYRAMTDDSVYQSRLMPRSRAILPVRPALPAQVPRSFAQLERGLASGSRVRVRALMGRQFMARPRFKSQVSGLAAMA